MATHNARDTLGDELERLHEAIVAADDVAEQGDLATAIVDDTDLGDGLRQAESCLRLLERARRKRSASSSRSLPHQIGRFRLERYLGEGAYGIVYLAFDPELSRSVALKIPRPEVVLSRALSERFLREGEAAASLDHPHIVSVYEAGSTHDSYYIASAYCHGSTLANWLKANPLLTPRDAASMMITLAEAVQHAHSRGVLHRDLKPANILLEPTRGDDERDQLAPLMGNELADAVRITDFGLARVVSDERQTQTGAVVGTPAYMAPEQAEGRLQDVSTASDVYALGTVLYELLTGEPPFQGDSVLAALEAVRSQPPIAPTAKNSLVPPNLSAICLKCLEKDPGARYVTANALADDLRRFLADEPISARSTGAAERAWRWCLRNRAVATLLAVLAISITLGATLVVWQWRLATHNLSIANRERAHSRQALDDMTSTAAADWLRSQPALRSEQRDFLHRAAEYYREFASAHADDEESLRWVVAANQRLGKILSWLGDHAQAEQPLQRAISLSKRRVAESGDVEWRKQLAQSLSEMTSLLFTLRRFDEAEAHAVRWLDQTEQLVRDDPGSQSMRLHAMAVDTLGSVYRHQHRIAESLLQHQRAIEIREPLAAAPEATTADQRQPSVTLNNLANTLMLQGQLADAEKALERASDIKRQLADDAPDVFQYQFDLAVGLNQLCAVRSRLDRWDQCLTSAQEALAIYQNLATTFPADERARRGVLETHLVLAKIYERLDDLQLAEHTYADGIALAKQLRSMFPSSTHLAHVEAQAYLGLGHMLRRAERFDDALDALDHFVSWAASRRDSSGSPDADRALLDGYWARASTLAEADRFDAALSDWDQAISLAPAELAAELTVARATTMIKADQVERAIQTTEQAIGDHAATPNLRYNAACVYALASTRVAPNRRDSYADRAIELLQSAIDLGFRDLTALQEDPELTSLHTREDFQRLLDAGREPSREQALQ